MELTEMLGSDARQITKRDHLEEMEQVACLVRGESLYVYARTEGRRTREAFGVPWHIGCACMRIRHAESLLAACSDTRDIQGAFDQKGDVCKGGPVVRESLVSVLRSLFQDDETHFSDLLDLLDRHGIPYSYRSISSYGALFRAESLT